MLKKFIFSLTAIMALSLLAIAQDAKPTTVEGYIVDKHCSAADMGTHGKGCVLSDGCIKSGLGVFADGKFTSFDENGATQAKAALEKSKKDKGAKFKVTGKVTGDKMSVQKIEEVL
jgi:hypothetical protein